MIKIFDWSIKFLVILSITTTLVSCGKANDYNNVLSSDKTEPGQVSNVRIENKAGSAVISYTLPNSENILYVEASYNIRNGVNRQTSASFYTNSLEVEGFAKDSTYDVELVVVSRANIRSAPVKVQIHPTKPPYLLAFDSLFVRPTFGGINAIVQNLAKKNVGLAILRFDSAYNRLRTVRQVFASDSVFQTTLRGYDTINYYWAFVTMDAFGNHSDTIYKWLKPIYEVQFKPYPVMTPYQLASDATNSWPVYQMINNTLSNANDNVNCWRGTSPAFPITATISLGGEAQLSRFILYGRQGPGNTFIWTNENPTQWTFWGSDVVRPGDAQLPMGAQKGEVAGDWVCLGRFIHPDKPSGQAVGTNSAADIALYANGFSYDFDLDIPNVRYIRFCAEGSFTGVNYIIVKELKFFGQINY